VQNICRGNSGSSSFPKIGPWPVLHHSKPLGQWVDGPLGSPAHNTRVGCCPSPEGNARCSVSPAEVRRGGAATSSRAPAQRSAIVVLDHTRSHSRIHCFGSACAGRSSASTGGAPSSTGAGYQSEPELSRGHDTDAGKKALDRRRDPQRSASATSVTSTPPKPAPAPAPTSSAGSGSTSAR